jgi:hypothetical protein
VSPAEAITSINFTGSLKDTFYLDEVSLVAAPAPPITAVLEEQTAVLPQTFSLAQNYPNPFNSATVIGFSLPEATDVELAVYNLAGQRVATLAQGNRAAGSYQLTWDGRDDAGRALASGVYVYRLCAGGKHEQAHKLLMLR